MEVTLSLAQVSFWLALFFTIIGGMLGLVGVWVDNFWDNDAAWKLFLTDCIFAGTSIIVAVLTRFLTLS